MSRKLDVDRLWHMAAERGLTPQALARRAGMRSDTDHLSRRGLEALTGAQLVAIADVLQVTVDELLTVEEPESGPNPASQTYTPYPGDDTRREEDPSELDANALQAAVLHFRSLPEQALMSALGWSQDRLNTATAIVHRRLEHSRMSVRRVCGRLEVDIDAIGSFLPETVAEELNQLWAESAVLGHEDTTFLVTAVRAHALGPYPGPPLVPWHVCQTLARQGAVLPAGDHARAGELVRLVPHPDMLFALHLTDQPAPYADPSAPQAARTGPATDPMASFGSY